MRGTSPALLCEDVTRFSSSQHYGNSPRLPRPRSIWFTNNYLWPPRPGEISEGQNIDERPVWKMKNCFKKWARVREWICDEEEAQFSGGMSQSQTNDQTQMDNRNRRVRMWRQNIGTVLNSFPLSSCCHTAGGWGLSERLKKNNPTSYANFQYLKFSYIITKRRWTNIAVLLCATVYTLINMSDLLDMERRPYRNEYPCLAVI